MQNFTFGRKGINWFLFAFILFVGNLASYGQDCATVTDEDGNTAGNQQSFCYLQTVDEIERTGTNTAIFETADTENDTQPISSEELLTDGVSYFVGSTSDPNCDRVAVEVSVDAVDTPDNSLFPGRNNFTLSPCISSDFTASDLEDLFTVDAGDNYTIEAYTSEFGTQTAEGSLEAGESYFVGQVSSVDGECPSTRAAVGYSPTEAPSPIAESNQTFCEGATVADLVAEGTEENTQVIRWYRSIASNTPLSDDVELINGEDYFASQIVNDRDDPFPPCETEMNDRTEVIVEVTTFDAGLDASETICQTDLQGRLSGGESPTEIFSSLVEDRSLPSDVTFNPTIASIVSDFNNDPFQTFTTLATFTTPEGCEDDVELSITVVEDFNAGDDSTGNTVCRADLSLPASENEVQAFFMSLVSDDADEGGDFSDISSITSRLNAGESGPFTSTYTVGAGTSCENSANLEVSIVNGTPANAGNFDPIQDVCSTEDPIDLTNLENNDPDATAGGTFTGTGVTDNMFDPSIGAGTYTITYSVDDSTPCTTGSEETEFDITVEDSFNAGDDSIGNIVCRDNINLPASQDEVRTYFRNRLSSDAVEGGTFSNIADITSRVNAGESGPFNATYTVGTGTACEDFAEISVSIVDPSVANAGDFDPIVNECSNEDLIDLTALTNNNPDATPGGTFTGTGVTDNMFDPSIGAGTYTITYSVDDSLPCVTGSSSITFEIGVTPGANAGDNSIGNVVCRDDINLPASQDEVRTYFRNRLSSDAAEGGTFSNIADITSRVNAGESGPFNTTYTVGVGTACEDFAEISVSIVDPSVANAGDFDPIVNECSNEDLIDLTALTNNDPDATPGGTFTGTGVTDNMFDPSIGAGTYTITYSVDDSLPCITGSEETEFDITVEDAPVSVSIDRTLCVTDARDLIADPITGLAFLQGLVEEAGVESFDANNFSDGAIVEATRLSNFIDAPTSDSETFNFEYSDPSDSVCDDGTITIAITINDLRDADAGTIDPQSVCESDEPIDLTDFLGEDSVPGGTFTGPGVTENMFDSSIGAGTYSITYSVDDSADCVTEGTEDEITFIITVEESFNAGDDSLGNIVCRTDVDLPASQDEVRTYFRNRLSSDAVEGGAFSNIAEITSLLNAGESGPFNTTYTVGANTTCEDSAEISVSIIDPSVANAGDFDPIEDVCSAEDPIDLTTLNNNDPDATIGGTFSGTGVTDNEFDPSVGAGTYTITYSVDDTTPCTTGSEETTFTITVQDSPLSTDVTRTLCITDARDLISDSEAGLVYLQALVEEAGVESFDPDNFNDGALAEAARLTNFIDTPTSDSETFDFQYTNPSDSVCNDGTINIEITINDLRDADAGDIENQTVCSTDGMIDLTDFFTTETIPGGTFSGNEVENNMFDSTIGANEDGYEITYTVDDSADCVTEGTSDSTTFIIFVNDGVNAGPDNDTTICRAEANGFDEEETREFYLDLLQDDVPVNGTFEPSIAQLIADYNNNEDQTVFTTMYTVSNGVCSDSVQLTVSVQDSLPAEIGDIADPDPICRNAEDVDLFSFLPADANMNGSFDGYEDGMFSPAMEGAGSFDITYTLTEDSPCTTGEASATFTITVLESANAGMNMDLTVCMNEGVQNLFESLSVDADDNGEFTLNGDVIADGMMNPADFEADEYTVIYTVAAINDCGEDTAEFTITVQETPDAPTVDGNPFTFCATDDSTGADLSATGTNLTYYSDEDLNTMVAPEDALIMGTYYVTQRSDEGGCESEATEITVNINDADTPTTTDPNPSFCEFDDATIADLTENINESGTITWYDSAEGDNALNSGTSLQDGVTYYATLFNVATGCESSVRLEVTVTIDDDCPLIIPEGFSPNGDGLNDRFEIRNIRDQYPNFTMEIRNRFGDMVYKGNANTPDWDGFSSEGSFGSDVLPAGAYFYYLNFNDGSTESIRGTVYLSR